MRFSVVRVIRLRVGKIVEYCTVPMRAAVPRRFRLARWEEQLLLVEPRSLEIEVALDSLHDRIVDDAVVA